MAKPLRLRIRAASDLDDATEYYRRESGGETAIAFIAAVEQAVGRIGRNPHVGSLRFSYELGIPDVRAWPLEGFPYLVFYVVGEVDIDVWRILHTRRDLAAGLSDEA